MLISRNLHMKSSKVSIKTRSASASLSFKGQATEHTTVKWSIDKKTISGQLAEYEEHIWQQKPRQILIIFCFETLYLNLVYLCKAWYPVLYVQNFQWVVKCYAVYALWLQYELKEIVNATPMFTLDHYLPIISTFIFANSNSGCTCSTYILWPSLLPPTGLINTRSLLGRLNPESEDKILVNHFHSQECHSGSYQWPANSVAPYGIFSLPFSVILPQKEIFP